MSLKEKLKAAADAAKGGRPARRPSAAVVKSILQPAKFNRHQGTVDGLRDSAGYRLSDVAGFLKGAVPESKIKHQLAVGEKLKAVFGGFYTFEPNSLLVPVSSRFLPLQVRGQEIHGAKEVVKEIREMAAAAVEGADVEGVHKALGTFDATAGGSFVPGPELGELIELQRAGEVFVRAGAREITLPASGQATLPKQTGATTAYWVGEAAPATDSQPTTGALNLRAKKLVVRCVIDIELMRMGTVGSELFVRRDFAAVAARAVDTAGLTGTGGTRPLGLLNYDTQTAWVEGSDKVLRVTPAAGSDTALTANDLVRLPSLLPDEVDGTAWVMTKKLWGNALGLRADDASGGGQGAFLFDYNRRLNDRFEPNIFGGKVVASSLVPNTRGSGASTLAIYGDFAGEWVIGRLGVMEFNLDPYTRMQWGQNVLQGMQFVDCGPRHLASFAYLDEIAYV